MTDVDPFQKDPTSSAAPDDPTFGERRDAAIEVGRRMGEETATKQGEPADVAAQRIARAMAYAAWEFDGKPAGVWTEYCAMFGVTTHVVTHQDDRDPYALLLSESERRAKKKS